MIARSNRNNSNGTAATIVAVIAISMVLACLFASDAILNKVVVPTFFGCMLFALGYAVVSMTKNDRRI